MSLQILSLCMWVLLRRSHRHWNWQGWSVRELCGNQDDFLAIKEDLESFCSTQIPLWLKTQNLLKLHHTRHCLVIQPQFQQWIISSVNFGSTLIRKYIGLEVSCTWKFQILGQDWAYCLAKSNIIISETLCLITAFALFSKQHSHLNWATLRSKRAL